MNIKKILIILGEPNSTFSEILLKYFNSSKFKNVSSKIILIGSFDLLNKQIKFLKYKNKLNKILDKSIVLINGPISKENFLKKKFPGITEYVAKKTNSKDPVMLIYNKKLAVSPLSTHIPINKVSKFVKKTKIINNIIKINDFYKSKNYLYKLPRRVSKL